MPPISTYAINVPVVDLRSSPFPHQGGYELDLQQESQLLYGERVKVHEAKAGWLLVEAIEQERFRKETGWTGYPGWIKEVAVLPQESSPTYNLVVQVPWASVRSEPALESPLLLELCMGTHLEGMEESGDWWMIRLLDGKLGAVLRKDVRLITPSQALNRPLLLKDGHKLLHHPYLWGGRSVYHPYNRSFITSCDCSGLVSLLYRLQGFPLPRDAHDQYLKSSLKNGKELEIGDLIFLAKSDRPERMNHVMLYAGEDSILDANNTDKKIVITLSEKRFGKSLKLLKNGERVGNFFFHFGAALKG